MTDNTQAIGLTWYFPKNRRRHSTKDVEQSVLRNVTALQVSKKIAAVLPFSHKPLKESDGNPWTDYWVIVLALDVSPDKVWEEVKTLTATVNGLLRAELLRIQPGNGHVLSAWRSQK